MGIDLGDLAAAALLSIPLIPAAAEPARSDRRERGFPNTLSPLRERCGVRDSPAEPPAALVLRACPRARSSPSWRLELSPRRHGDTESTEKTRIERIARGTRGWTRITGHGGDELDRWMARIGAVLDACDR